MNIVAIRRQLNKYRDEFVLGSIVFVISSIFFLFVQSAETQSCENLQPGQIFSVEGSSAVYFLNANLERLYFPNSEVFYSWYEDFSEVVKISGSCVDQYQSPKEAPFGVNYRPGSKLVKTTTSNDVYAVLPGNKIKKIDSEEVAESLYGSDWSSLVRDIPEVYWSNFVVETGTVSHLPHNGMLLQRLGDESVYIVEENKLKKVIGELNEKLEQDIRTLLDSIFSVMEQGESVLSGAIIANPAQDGLTKKLTDKKEISQKKKIEESMTMVVTVPENTFLQDKILVYTYQKEEPFVMNSVGGGAYSVDLPASELNFLTKDGSDRVLKYRYARNGYGFAGAEYLEPDTQDYFETERGREVIFDTNKQQLDNIERWRFLPQEKIEKDSLPDLEPAGTFLRRVNNITFRAGQGIQDFYIEDFDDHFVSTASHMKRFGSDWAVLYPSWDWDIDTDIPTLTNNLEYPDEKLLKQIRDYKEGEVSVIVAPKICCSKIDTENKDEAWWQSYFAEVERFYFHEAWLAETTKAESFVINFADVGVTADLEENIQNIEKEAWGRIVNEVKKVYSGEVGQSLWNSEEFSTSGLNIDPNFITWAKDLDFFYVFVNRELSSSSNPLKSKLRETAENELDKLEVLYNVLAKPVMVETEYPSLQRSWRGYNYQKEQNENCHVLNAEDDCETVFSEEAQSRALHAFWQSMGDRPWIIGYIEAGYWQWEMPRLTDASIRGKSAEDLWSAWSGFVKSQQVETIEAITCTQNSAPVFVNDFTDLDMIENILPPSSSGTEVNTEATLLIDGGANVPVYAPTDITLKTGNFYLENNQLFYKMNFEVSCEVTISFDYIRFPVDKIRNVFPRNPSQQKEAKADSVAEVNIKAGELIGYTTGDTDGNWSVGLWNSDRPNHLSELYESDKFTKAGCVFDYFGESVRDAYYNKFLGEPGEFCKQEVVLLAD